MVNLKYVPEAGDLVWIDFNPQSGHEQAGRRPALVLSPAGYNGKSGLAILCPITNQEKGYPFEVPLPRGLLIKGCILADHVKNLDWKSRHAEKSGSAPKHVLDDVRSKIMLLLGVED
jgi:mRNA interferase MazF